MQRVAKGRANGCASRKTKGHALSSVVIGQRRLEWNPGELALDSETGAL